MTADNSLKTTTSLPLAVRAGVALAIVVILSFAWTTAERSSHQAVQTAQATLSRTYVTLPRVEIVAKRERATPVAVRATAKRQG
ncbi:MAG TPA: hypothetical protein VGF26_02195 [Ramlibacter sp.]